MAQFVFDATTVAPQESPAPIPAGTYLAHIVESDERALKSGAGRGIALTFEILAGPFARRKVWTNINYRNSSADAERIGQAQLSALCHAVGVLKPQDTTQLHMRPVMIRVSIRKDESGRYGDRNEVKGIEAPPQGAVPGAPAAGFPPAAAPAAPPAAQAANSPPWAKRA